MFENERFLPFRGWGHEWPGHLLPTDRVGHWSLCEETGPAAQRAWTSTGWRHLCLRSVPEPRHAIPNLLL